MGLEDCSGAGTQVSFSWSTYLQSIVHLFTCQSSVSLFVRKQGLGFVDLTLCAYFLICRTESLWVRHLAQGPHLEGSSLIHSKMFLGSKRSQPGSAQALSRDEASAWSILAPGDGQNARTYERGTGQVVAR